MVAVGVQGRIGERFAAWQSPAEVATSADGVAFTNRGPITASGGGHVTNAIDAAGAFYAVQLCSGTIGSHVCLHRSLDGGQTWPQRTDFPDLQPGTSERPWLDVFPRRPSNATPNPDATRVYVQYHTRATEELPVVAVSTDGGKTFGEPRVVTTGTNARTGSLCNTIPAGVAVDQTHGTIYALWLSGGDVSAGGATGCNYPAIGPYTKAWVSVSADGGDTWTARLAWQGNYDPLTKIGDSANKTFPSLAVDAGGQVHVALAVRRNDAPLRYVNDCQVSPGTCAETPQDTDLLLVTSPDQGAHWTLPRAMESSPGSYFFPWAAAGTQGRLNVAFYRSPTRQPNKRDSVWNVGLTRVTVALATYSSGANAGYISAPVFEEVLIDPLPVHGNGTSGGGICTFGLFCGALGTENGNRSVGDSLGLALDPVGGANVIWTDDAGQPREIHFACQDSGAGVFASEPELNGCYGPADLSVTQTDSPDPVAPGQTVTYRIEVRNNGTTTMPATTSGVRIEDVLPAGVTLVSATTSAGTCSGSGPVVCAIGTLPGGGTATVTIVVRVASGTSGSITNSVSVSSATADGVTANNTSTESTAVASAPPPSERGDANGDGQITLSDVFYLFHYLFEDGPAPIGNGDANGDGAVTLSDVFYLIELLYA